MQIINNGFGLIGIVGSHISANGPVLIQGNTTDGVRLRNASGELGPANDGAAGPVIQQNGTSATNITLGNCCALPAGVSVTNNSDLDISAGIVANNSAPGLVVQDNSSVRVIGAGSLFHHAEPGRHLRDECLHGSAVSGAELNGEREFRSAMRP
ncbi:MAG TPA: hypothetical protein VE783_03920 [Candidatus Limnocylindrales bacterium]|nr:hypothetical protein [Candidatus Limnocylindrales bacterium]